MGGRGGSSGLSPSSEQQRLMDGLKRRNEHYGWSVPKFGKNKDGSVSYEYTREKIVHHVHGGKMQGPEKNDIYRRTEVVTGKIMKDGLRRENKPVKTETLIKRGKR
ncbi:hypothetical protein [Blautia sp. MSJ-19]|uniref:hypothetical protein n=1 Tax=Blautia sp. MSJ-19 TaxID=2841517 RepID=UPI001C0E9D4C|nr:hypothetical protein [Blautia sp. MSJ-19]MBU5481733.1 hypothetical protein [Blautia sp. MSJ-19]